MSISHCRFQNWGDSGPSELMRSLKTESRGRLKAQVIAPGSASQRDGFWWVRIPDLWEVGGREQKPSSIPRFRLWSWPDPTYLVGGRVVHPADAVDSLQEARKKSRHAGNTSRLGGRCPCLGGPPRVQGDQAAMDQQVHALFLNTCLPSRSVSSRC